MQNFYNMFKRTPPAEGIGNLYKDHILMAEDASLEVTAKEFVFSVGYEVKHTLSFKTVEHLDFAETESKEPGLSISAGKEKWIFVIRKNLPQSAMQVYGKVSALIPKINNWEIVHVADHVMFRAYDHVVGTYVDVDPSATISIIKEKGGRPLLRVYNQYKVYRQGDSTQEGSEFYIDQNGKSFSWAVQDGKNACVVLRVVFQMLPTLFSFFSLYLSASRKEPLEDSEYFEKMEIDNYCLDPEEEKKSSEESEEESSTDSEEGAEHARKAGQKSKPVPGNIFGGRTRERNKALAVGKEKAFISRGSSIGVFTHGDKELEFGGSFANISAKGHSIDPSKILIADGGNSLMLTETGSDSNIHRLDLQTGKIAETWSAEADMKDFFSASKDEQGIARGEAFLGITPNSVFKLDPRTRGIVEGKKYATSTKFLSGDANTHGEFAIGSETGDIRMYNHLDKRAKTLLPGLGDPILGMFISPSGKYIVCTCKSYLMLITTEANGTSGFKKSLGKDKPVPKKLIVRPEHRQEFGKEVNFTHASISTDEKEKFVIVSTGEWVIIWNMEKVLRGEVFSYQIKKSSDTVVSNSFIPGNSNKIVVAMDDDIQLISRKSLKNPNVYQKSR
ncbi:hypothetical protein NECID01_1127 [Nematocida sp. AWRm77]|nr:hypothetical protein NECID01_1127 [Nematocida sp. AWRm77]